MANIHDVAKMAGVHRSTVSRVLTGKGSSSEKSRKKVIAAARKLNYHINTVASALKSQRKTAIGFLSFWNCSPNPSEAYYQQTLTGIIDGITRSQYHLVLNNIQGLAHQENEELKFIHESLLAGLILMAPRTKEADLAFLKDLNIPSLLLYYRTDDPDYSYIDLDNRKGAQMAVDYLVGLGHRRIGFIGGEIELSSNARDRYTGYQRSLKKAGIPEDPNLVHQRAFSYEEGREGVKRFLMLPKEKRPTAIFCSTDNMAVGAMDAIQDSGLKVPADISVVGFDDYFQALNFRPVITTGQQSSVHYEQSGGGYPDLTTIRQPFYHIGQKSVEVLEAMIEGPGGKKHVLVEPELRVRQSTAPPSKD